MQFAPKLSADHVELPVGRNMKASISAQTLSNTTTAAVRSCMQLNMMPKEALDTADFMMKVNAIFDLGNDTSPNQPAKKAAVCKASLTEKLVALDSAIEWIGDLRFFSNTTHKESKRHTFPDGWRIALRSMRLLSEELLNDGLRHVPLRRLGQDHIENILCCVRGKNGFNDHPEVSACRPALRATAL